VNGHKAKSAVAQLGAKFCAANPDVRVEFLSGELESLLRDIADRRLDAAFVPARSEQEATSGASGSTLCRFLTPQMGCALFCPRRAARTCSGCLKKCCCRTQSFALGAAVKFRPGIKFGLRSANAPGSEVFDELPRRRVAARDFRFYFFPPLRPFPPSSKRTISRSSSMVIVTAVTRPTIETSSG
jgi:hypothetical protein